MDTQASREMPLGATVENINPSPIPAKKTYPGVFFVKLHPVDPEDDVDELFLNSHGCRYRHREVHKVQPHYPHSDRHAPVERWG